MLKYNGIVITIKFYIGICIIVIIFDDKVDSAKTI